MSRARSFWLLCSLLVACEIPEEPYPESPGPLPDPQMPDDAQAAGQVLHAVQPFALEGSQETMTCYSWTVDNDAPLYVQDVTFQNGGSFHHSNWFVVPEDVYPGEDGFWPCAERDFNDISAALAGTVLFAQSTQAQREAMAFTEGAVIRIPARSKIVAGVHLLNLGPDPRETAAWLSLDAIHPALVETILSPLMLSYRDLDIPPMTQSRFTGTCLGPANSDEPFELHYVLPHYHRTGTSASMTVFASGEPTVVLDHEGFGASPMGKSFDPPLSFHNVGGFEFSCSYDNPHDESLSWGVGIHEMCVFLAFASTTEILVGGIDQGRSFSSVLDEEGVTNVAGGCSTLASPKGPAYAYPTREEIEGPLRLPPLPDEPVPEPPTCENTEGVYEADEPPSFEEIRSRVLEPWCSFSSCHGEAAAGGLSLVGDEARDALVGVPSLASDRPRVEPGDPEGSYLYHLLSECEPQARDGAARPMPAGAPTLLDPALVGLVRAWIEAGAL